MSSNNLSGQAAVAALNGKQFSKFPAGLLPRTDRAPPNPSYGRGESFRPCRHGLCRQLALRRLAWKRNLTVKEMSRATYRAEQFPGAVVIFATGAHFETGYRVSFERVGVTVFPPQFSFMHERPGGDYEQSLTPFAHYLTFETEKRVHSVVIYDADGRHTVPVRQVCECEPAEIPL